jgi:geranylgeranyl diphosphate synthase type II
MIWNRCDEELALVEAGLLSILDGADIPSPLKESMAYSLMAGGKRLRPLLLLKSCRCFGGSLEAAVPLACALEMIHTYSLIHDDLPCMDDDELRRGRPTNHVVYGQAMALLAGDGLLNLAYETMLSRIPDGEAARSAYCVAMARIASAAGPAGMIAGQCIDIRQTGKDCGREELARMHHLKTGRLFEAAMAAGALLAGAGRESLEQVMEYAGIWVCFSRSWTISWTLGRCCRAGEKRGQDRGFGEMHLHNAVGRGRRAAEAPLTRAARSARPTALTPEVFFHELIGDLLRRQN